MKTLSFFTKYSTQGASSRYRHFNFFYKLQLFDYSLEIDNFLDTDYLISLYTKTRISKFKIIISYFKRFFSLMRSSENLIIEYELFPYLPYWFEKMFLANKHYILNFDDNVWDIYKNKFWLNNKYNQLVKKADGVIVANEFLSEKVKKLNENVINIPTAIDLDDYKRVVEKDQVFTIVWVGTPVTYRYIESHQQMFQELTNRIDYQLCIVANRELEAYSLPGVNMQFIDWSPENEVKYLKQAHIGIMPLDSDAFSQGKSAFKLIQYLAAGIPLVGSAVGENNNVINNGKNGFLVSSSEEWVEKIELLYNNIELRELCAKNAQEDAYEYSIQKYFPEYKDFIDETFL